MDNTVLNDKDIRNKTIVNILHYLFYLRVDKNYWDIPLVKSMIKKGVITQEKIKEQFYVGKPRFVFGKNLYLSALYAIIDDCKDPNSKTLDIVMEYLNSFYILLPKDFLKLNLRLMMEADEKINGDEHAESIMFSILYYIYKEDYAEFGDSHTVVNNVNGELCTNSVVNILYSFVYMQRLKTDATFSRRYLSTYFSTDLGIEDLHNNKIIDRYIERRTNEIINYIFKTAKVDTKKINDLTEDELYLLIGLTAYMPQSIENMVDIHTINKFEKLGLIIKNQKYTRDFTKIDVENQKVSNENPSYSSYFSPINSSVVELAIEEVGNCIGNGLNYILGVEFCNTVQMFLDQNKNHFTNLRKTIRTVLLTDLCEKIEIAKRDDSVENIEIESIVRKLELTKSDIEKFFVSLKYNMLLNSLSLYIRNEIDDIIDNMDLDRFETYFTLGIVPFLTENKTPDDISMNTILNLENSKLAKEVVKQNKTIENQSTKIEDLKGKLLSYEKNQCNKRKKDIIIDNLKHENSKLTSTIEQQNDKIAKLQKKLEGLEQDSVINKKTDSKNVENYKTEIISDEDVANIRPLFLGGRKETIDLLSKIFPNGMFVDSATKKNVNLQPYDCVCVFTDWIRHALIKKYETSMKNYEKPILYLSVSNVDIIKEHIINACK